MDFVGGYHSKLVNELINLFGERRTVCELLKPGFHKANFDHDNDQFGVKAKRLVERMTSQSHNRFVFCVVVVEFAVAWFPLSQLRPRQRPI